MRYIGVFDTREKAALAHEIVREKLKSDKVPSDNSAQSLTALAYEIVREKLKSDKLPSDNSAQSLKATETAVNSALKAAFEGVNEKGP